MKKTIQTLTLIAVLVTGIFFSPVYSVSTESRAVVSAAQTLKPLAYSERPTNQTSNDYEGLIARTTSQSPGVLFNIAATAETRLPGGIDHGYADLLKRPNPEGCRALYDELAALCDAYQRDRTAVLTPNDTGDYLTAALDVSPFSLTNEQISYTFAVFFCDNPQYFMFNGTYYVSGTSYVFPCVVKEYAAPAARKAATDLVERVFKEYKAAAAGLTKKLDIARMVHDLIIARCDYSYVGGAPDKSDAAHSIIGVFDKSKRGATCEGYSEAFQYILNRLGVRTLAVTGRAGAEGSSPGGHEWNLVLGDDGKYYYVDVTWDDLDDTGSDPKNLLNSSYHRYFLAGSNDATMKKTHFPSDPKSSNIYPLYDLPANIAQTYYNADNYKQGITDNAFYGKSYGYPVKNSAYIGFGTKADGHREDSKTMIGGAKFFGTYTYNAQSDKISVVAPEVSRWNYSRSGGYDAFDGRRELKQGVDYRIEIEKPYKEGANRAYIYGMGEYTGVDFGIVNLVFAEASIAPSPTPTPVPTLTQTPKPTALPTPAQVTPPPPSGGDVQQQQAADDRAERAAEMLRRWIMSLVEWLWG